MPEIVEKPEKADLTELRTLVAYWGLPIGKNANDAHGYSYNTPLWQCEYASASGNHFSFSKSLTYFSGANQHFSRISRIARYILSVSDPILRKELLRQITETQPDSDTNEETEDEYFFSLGKIFYEARKRFEGMGVVRVLVNPPGFVQNDFTSASRADVINPSTPTGFTSLPRERQMLLVMLGIIVSPFALACGTWIAFVYTLIFTFGSIPASIVDPRAKRAYCMLWLLDIAIAQQNFDDLSPEENFREKTSMLGNPHQLSIHQRWMFEPFSGNTNYPLGRDITKLILGSRDSVNNANDILLLHRILNNLKQYKIRHPSEEVAILEFFLMDLSKYKKNNSTRTFIDIMSNKPGLRRILIDFLKTFEPNRCLWLVLRAHKPLIATELETHFIQTFHTNPSNNLFVVLKDHIKNGIPPSLIEMREWIEPLSNEFKRHIFRDLLTNPTAELVAWLKQQSNAKKILKAWMIFFMMQDANLDRTPVQNSALYADSEFTITHNQIKMLISGVGAPPKVSYWDSKSEEWWNRQDPLYKTVANFGKNKERIIEYINGLSAPAKIQPYLDINDINKPLGLFFGRPRDSNNGFALPHKGTRGNIIRKLDEAEKECIRLFKRQNTVNADICNHILDKPSLFARFTLSDTPTVSRLVIPPVISYGEPMGSDPNQSTTVDGWYGI